MNDIKLILHHQNGRNRSSQHQIILSAITAESLILFLNDVIPILPKRGNGKASVQDHSLETLVKPIAEGLDHFLGSKLALGQTAHSVAYDAKSDLSHRRIDDPECQRVLVRILPDTDIRIIGCTKLHFTLPLLSDDSDTIRLSDRIIRMIYSAGISPLL